MPIEGPLRELQMHDVFQLLDLGRKTGVLSITSPLRRNHGRVLFDRGAVVGAAMASNPHPLGELLVRAGRAQEGDILQARRRQEQGDPRRLGEILVADGILTARELERLVRQQIEDVIFELTSWTEGYFSFEESPDGAPALEAEVRVSSEQLLLEAARRVDEWERIQTRVPSLEAVPRYGAEPPAGEGHVSLLPVEWELLAEVDGDRDVRTLAASLGRSEFEVARSVFALRGAGLLELAGPAEAPVDVAEPLQQARQWLAAGRVEEAVLLIEQHLALEPSSGAALRLLGSAEVARGRFAAAIAAWERWLALQEIRSDDDAQPDTVRGWIASARMLAGAVGEMA